MFLAAKDDSFEKKVVNLRCDEFEMTGSIPRGISGRYLVVGSGDHSELNGDMGVIYTQVIVTEKQSEYAP